MNYKLSPLQAILSFVFSIAVIAMLLYFGVYVLKGLFKILSFLAPILIFGALIIDRRVVLNYGRWLVDLLRTRTLYGIIAVVLTVFFFPAVAAWLFFRALMRRRIKNRINSIRGGVREEYIEYEEVDSEIIREKSLRDGFR